MPQDILQKNWLGRGIAFPIDFDPLTQDLERAEFEESVRQSILIILGTAKGERVMRPDFGCGIYDLVFEPNTPSTASKVAQVVQEALLFFEPRIDVVDIRVESRFDREDVPADRDGNLAAVSKLMIFIDYEVRATNNVFNLVYPFYLERSPG
jgi:uncharacterized protein